MSAFRLRMDCRNAAFDDMPGAEIARILRGIVARLEDGDVRVGQCEYDAPEVEDAEPWRVRLTYHCTQYREAMVEVPRAAASDERAAAAVAMDMVRANPALAVEDGTTSFCDVEADYKCWRDESGDYGL